MYCRISEIHVNLSDPGSLPARLRALPALAPPAGGWRRMQARLASRRRRLAVAASGFALAASVVVAASVALLRPAAPPAGGDAAAQPEVARLIARSQTLERELASARPQVAVWTSGRETTAAALEQRVRLIDAQLNYAGPESAARLWRDRVKVMNALVQLHEDEGPAPQYASYQY